MTAIYDTTIVASKYASQRRSPLTKDFGPIDYHTPLRPGERIKIIVHETKGDAVYNILVDYIEPSKGPGSLPRVQLRCTDMLSQEEQLDNIKGGLLNRRV